MSEENKIPDDFEKAKHDEQAASRESFLRKETFCLKQKQPFPNIHKP